MNIMAIAKALCWFTSINVHATTLYTLHMHVSAIPQNFHCHRNTYCIYVGTIHKTFPTEHSLLIEVWQCKRRR